MAKSLDEIIQEKLDRLETVPDAFTSSIDKHQGKVYRELLGLLEGLDREAGNIVISEANIARIEQIINGLKDVFFDKDYLAAVKTFAGEFDTQAKITKQLFAVGFDEIPNDKLFQEILRVTKRNAVSLFNDQAISQEYFEPLRISLTTSITSGASYKDTVESIRALTLGNSTAEGLVQSHAKTIARTSFSISDRAYTTQISQAYNIEFYKYSGSTIETTRPFCDSRHNKFYHKKEVEAWGDLDPWAGWMKGTNSSTIFTNLGGWNCRHSLIPVSVFAVPKKDILRAIDKGFFKPDDKMIERLGL